MSFKQASFNTTKQLLGGNILTGSRDAVFLRNKYQTELNNAHAALVNMLHHVEDDERLKITKFVYEAEKLESDILAHTAERENLYSSLDELLEKELGQEYSMFKMKPQGASVTAEKLGASVHIGGGLGGTNISNAASIRYLEKYPELQTKASFSTILHKIQDKEREIRQATEKCNQEIAWFKSTIPWLESDLAKCTDKLAVYRSLLSEWEKERKSCRYFQSTWFRLLPADKKAELLPDTITHRVDQFTHSLDMFQQELITYKNHRFLATHDNERS